MIKKFQHTLLPNFFVFFVFPLATFVVFALSLPKKVFGQFNATNPGDFSASNPSDNPSSTGTNVSYQLDNPLSGTEDIGSFIKKILDIVLTIGIPIVTFFIIYAGFLFVTARGNTEKLSTAKSTLGYTLLGAAILLGSWVLAQALGETIKSLQ